MLNIHLQVIMRVWYPFMHWITLGVVCWCLLAGPTKTKNPQAATGHTHSGCRMESPQLANLYVAWPQLLKCQRSQVALHLGYLGIKHNLEVGAGLACAGVTTGHWSMQPTKTSDSTAVTGSGLLFQPLSAAPWSDQRQFEAKVLFDMSDATANEKKGVFKSVCFYFGGIHLLWNWDVYTFTRGTEDLPTSAKYL